MALMKTPNKAKKIVSLDELKEYFYESFVEGYKHLGWVIDQKKEKFKNVNLPVVSATGLETWARGFEKKIKNGFEKDLKMLDKNISENINFELFSKWIYYDQNLYIKYGFEELMIATSVTVLDNFKLENDPRVTKVGKILRKTSLDELPQLINIIRGDLSIIGPRPIVEEELEKYKNNKNKFLSITPGLTGYWAANGRSCTTYEQRMSMELFYIDNFSWKLDMKIFIKTIFAVLKKEGAV